MLKLIDFDAELHFGTEYSSFLMLKILRLVSDGSHLWIILSERYSSHCKSFRSVPEGWGQYGRRGNDTKKFLKNGKVAWIMSKHISLMEISASKIYHLAKPLIFVFWFSVVSFGSGNHWIHIKLRLSCFFYWSSLNGIYELYGSIKVGCTLKLIIWLYQ